MLTAFTRIKKILRWLFAVRVLKKTLPVEIESNKSQKLKHFFSALYFLFFQTIFSSDNYTLTCLVSKRLKENRGKNLIDRLRLNRKGQYVSTGSF